MNRKKVMKFLRWFCPEHLYEEISGDLLQKYEKDVRAVGKRRAGLRLFWNTIRFFRPSIILRNQLSFNLFGMSIVTHYLTFTQRVLFRHKLFSLLNLSGLAVGMALCMLMVTYVLYERSFDRFHSNADRIVRVSYDRLIDGELQLAKAQVFPGVSEVLRNEIPEVEDAVRMFPFTTYVEAFFTTPGSSTTFVETDVYAVDSSFMKVFSLSLIHGDRRTALQGGKKMLLSSSAAKKYFGTGEAMNKTIHWDGMGDWTVTGVFDDLPANSHMKFDILVSWENVYGDNLWNWDGFYTYLLLKPGSNHAELETKIQRVLESKILKGNKTPRVTSQFHVQPVTDIHLHSALSGEMQVNGNSRVVDALLIAAVSILALALVNYLNLSLARIVRRTREVGVRKVIGSTRKQLMSLFFTESAVLNVPAFIIAVGLYFLAIPVAEVLTGKRIDYSKLNVPGYFIIAIPFALILFSWLAGLYPARLITALQPANGIKGIAGSLKRPRFSRLLLVFQFAVTIVLLGGSLVVRQQLAFMQQQDLGFNGEQRLVIHAYSRPDSANLKKMGVFKAIVLQDPAILSSTTTSNIPGRENEWVGRLKRVADDNDREVFTARTRVDIDFIKTFGLKLIAGRNFNDETKRHAILNESAVSVLGFKNASDALGTMIMRDYEIIGVVKDFHERGLYETIMPSFYTMGEGYTKFITLHVKSEDLQHEIAFLEQQWKNVFPDRPFDYFFLDEFFDQHYKREVQLARVIAFFSALGIFVACLGLFGFTYFMVHQRIKEIGIRKVLGATAVNLLRLLYSEFFWLLLLAGIVAAPLTYWLTDNWLSEYAYRIELHPWYLFLPMALVSLIAFLTIGALLWKAVRTNPVDSLKYE